MKILSPNSLLPLELFRKALAAESKECINLEEIHPELLPEEPAPEEIYFGNRHQRWAQKRLNRKKKIAG